MQRKVYPVSAVNRYVKQLLQQDTILLGLWISGEISNFKRHSSGHLYFTLKDPEGSIAAVMFAGDARTLNFRPQDGQQVQVQGYVSLYEKTGQYLDEPVPFQDDAMAALRYGIEGWRKQKEWLY